MGVEGHCVSRERDAMNKAVHLCMLKEITKGINGEDIKEWSKRAALVN